MHYGTRVFFKFLRACDPTADSDALGEVLKPVRTGEWAWVVGACTALGWRTICRHLEAGKFDELATLVVRRRLRLKAPTYRKLIRDAQGMFPELEAIYDAHEGVKAQLHSLEQSVPRVRWAVLEAFAERPIFPRPDPRFEVQRRDHWRRAFASIVRVMTPDNAVEIRRWIHRGRRGELVGEDAATAQHFDEFCARAVDRMSELELLRRFQAFVIAVGRAADYPPEMLRRYIARLRAGELVGPAATEAQGLVGFIEQYLEKPAEDASDPELSDAFRALVLTELERALSTKF